MSACPDCSGSKCICRTRDVIAWAKSRIAECQRQEEKFGRDHGSKRGVPQALIEAWTERRTLQAVLKQLGVNMEGA